MTRAAVKTPREHDASRAVGRARTTRARKTDVLEVANLSIRFGGLHAVDDVSLRIAPGAFVGLIGPNGAGKTTMLNALSGFVAPSAGSIRFMGTDISKLPSHERARLGIGRCFQNVGLDKRQTVLENLRIALETGRFAKELLFAAFGPRDGNLPPTLQERVDRVVDLLSLKHLLSKRVGELSTGTAKIIEVSCALLRRPRLLLLDEPSSGLSPNEANDLIDALLIAKETEGFSMLMVDHDMRLTMANVEHVFVLSFGKLLAEGTPDEVTANTAVIEAYLGQGPQRG